MNVTAPASTVDFVDLNIPDWLQDCLNARSACQLSDPEDLRTDPTLICRAFEFAYQLHKDQSRASGEPYICHPVAVAGLLLDLGGSNEMVAAGFLHDIVEDTEVTPEELEQQFGSEVRQLVEGVTKLSKFSFSSKTERQAENFRRMDNPERVSIPDFRRSGKPVLFIFLLCRCIASPFIKFG